MKRVLIILFLGFGAFVSDGQIITTYAGNGISGAILGDGGPATNAEIATPYGLNFDDTGNLLICQEDIIRKVNKTTSTIYTIAGSTTASGASCGGTGGDGCLATNAFILEPYSVCVDSESNYYIADRWYSEVRKITVTTGIIDTFAGNRSTGGSGDGGSAKNAGLNDPFSLCFDPAQHYLYISNEFGYSVRKVNMTTDTITGFAGTGVNGYGGDSGLAINAKFGILYGICSDNAGNIYIGDWGNKRIRKVDVATGIVTTIVGNGIRGYSGDGGVATSAMISAPYALCFDKCGNLYFSDSNRVRRIDGITNIITTVAGNGIAGFSGDSGLAINAELLNPVGIAIDSSGNLFISDQGNNRVRKVTIFNPFIHISATSGDTICVGVPVTVQATIAGGGQAPSFQWVINGTAMSATTSSSYTFTPATGDSVRCTLTSSSGCVGNPVATSNTIHLVLAPATTPTITITANSIATIGSIVTVNATVSGSGSSYNINWYNHGVLFNTTTVPTVTYTKAAGTDNITASVISTSVGCYDSTTSSVFVITALETGINTMITKPLHIYPNPTNDLLHIDQVSTRSGFSIMSMVGSVLLQGALLPGANSVSVKALPPGVYMMELYGGDGERIVGKVVKE